MKHKNYIEGEWRSPFCEQWIDSINPATEEVCGQIPRSGPEDVDVAVKAAQKAFVKWSQTSVEERAQWLERIADAIDKNRQHLAEVESMDQGKPVSLAFTMDIPRASSNFRFFAGAIRHQESESVFDSQFLNYVTRKPVGVAGLISPWNLPLYLLTWKIAPALAAGNTVVCKPSEMTSLTAIELGKIMQEIGLPAGVCNFVFGLGPDVGEALVKHSQVPLISFTGGTATGQRIMREAAAHTKRLSLELGGKNANIIFADCDFDEAVKGSVRAAFLNQGEICLCGSRIYVQKEILEKFTKAFVEQTKKLIVGDPKDAKTFMGPVVSKDHQAKILGFIEDARKEGGQILTGGDRPNGKGFFVNPTVITGLKDTSKCIQEEIFGPVVTISPFDTEEEVIRRANDVRYGLSASLWTKNLDTAHRVAKRMDVGTVWINCWMQRDLRVPFGGAKASGLGREGGRHSLEFFTEATNVCLQLSPGSGA